MHMTKDNNYYSAVADHKLVGCRYVFNRRKLLKLSAVANDAGLSSVHGTQYTLPLSTDRGPWRASFRTLVSTWHGSLTRPVNTVVCAEL